jgi:uncharacterized protein (DUF1800 family)
MQERDYIRAFRFGFGMAAEGSFEPWAEVAQPSGNPQPSVTAMTSRFEVWEAMSQRVKESAHAPAIVEEERALSSMLEHRDIHEEIVGAVRSPQMFIERLALMWSNHFSLGSSNAAAARLAAPHSAILRSAMFGRFRDLLQAAVLSPAMMQYLNLQQAVGPNSRAAKNTGRGLNENLGREILELHSLGANAGYSQQDVGALSRLLTGWHFDGHTGVVSFADRRAEPGVKNFLGHTIGGPKPIAEDLDKAFDVIASHPSTARFIANKLVLHFFGQGQVELSKQLTAVFQTSSGDLPTCYRFLLDASEKMPLLQTQFRNDVVFLISVLRSLRLRDGVLDFQIKDTGRPKSNPATTGALSSLRQKLWLAPSPAGWSDEPSYWRSPSVMMARLQVIPRLARLAQVEEPLEWAEKVMGPMLRAATRNAVSLAPNKLQGMGLVLASPEFNRR